MRARYVWQAQCRCAVQNVQERAGGTCCPGRKRGEVCNIGRGRGRGRQEGKSRQSEHEQGGGCRQGRVGQVQERERQARQP